MPAVPQPTHLRNKQRSHQGRPASSVEELVKQAADFFRPTGFQGSIQNQIRREIAVLACGRLAWMQVLALDGAARRLGTQAAEAAHFTFTFTFTGAGRLVRLWAG